jgi:hypothetical protein
MMLALGWQSKREITRTRMRVRTAMAAQTRDRGRYLGGRPPYGYRLADAGPHPNKAHAAWGRRVHRLEPDPHTAPIVRWMFTQRLAGHSLARITRALNDAGIPCPSAADPKRNPHRSGQAWTLGTVAAMLANPRYTGLQVWNRQRTDHDLIDPANTGLGHRQVQRWNLPDGWVISTQPAHPALVSEADFIAVQEINAPRGPTGLATRRYLLAGLIRCGTCERRLESAWSNGRPAYRCRHGYTSTTRPDSTRAKNVYIREDQILPHLAALAILLASDEHVPGHPGQARQIGSPAQAAALIDHLRSSGRTLTYDPQNRTLQADTEDAVRSPHRNSIPPRARPLRWASWFLPRRARGLLSSHTSKPATARNRPRQLARPAHVLVRGRQRPARSPGRSECPGVCARPEALHPGMVHPAPASPTVGTDAPSASGCYPKTS